MSAGHNTIYILGAVDINSLSYYPLDPYINRAFNSSKYLVTEPQFMTMQNAKIRNRVIKMAQHKGRTRLSQAISKETIEKLKRYLVKNKITFNNFEDYKAWFIADIIEDAQLRKIDYYSNFRMDRYFVL